jgi:hypothetical protein
MTEILWRSIGELQVTKNWQQFPDFLYDSPTLRLTTTILNQQNWDSLKTRSGAYIRFVYLSLTDNALRTQPLYVPVSEMSVIREFPLLEEFAQRNLTQRYVECKLSSNWTKYLPQEAFAEWTLKIEELV